MVVNGPDIRDYRMEGADIAWCPGCGNFAILKAVQQALADLRIPPTKVVLVSGIGQAAKLPHYLKAHVFNGLHGRALPPATAIKVANPSLTVLAESGDGDMYGEGGNHFLHTIRRNPDITNIVHNNMVYGLTKGQASPTSPVGFTTPVQINGVFLEPFNPLAVAIALVRRTGVRLRYRADPGDPQAGDRPSRLCAGRYFPALRHLQQGQHLPVVQGQHLLSRRHPQSAGSTLGLPKSSGNRQVPAGNFLSPSRQTDI
jgi:hypothetical protein